MQGAYFVTLCTWSRRHWFGRIDGTGHAAVMEPNAMGRIVLDQWNALPRHFAHVQLDQVQLMPDHFHAIIILAGGIGSTLRADATAAAGATTDGSGATEGAGPGTNARPNGTRPGSLGAIIGAFKSGTTYHMNRLAGTPGQRYWQPGFHDRVIRVTYGEFERIARYIAQNPSKWW